MHFALSEDEISLVHQGIQVIYAYSIHFPYHSKYMIMLEKLEQQHPNWTFLAVDMDHFITQTKRFKITCLPNILIFDSSILKQKLEGIISFSTLQQTFSDLNSQQER